MPDMDVDEHKTDAHPAKGHHIKIATYNVHCWVDSSHNNNLDRVVEVVNFQDPDIICLQEVYPCWELPSLLEFMRKTRFVHSARWDGCAILSKQRYKLLEFGVEDGVDLEKLGGKYHTVLGKHPSHGHTRPRYLTVKVVVDSSCSPDIISNSPKKDPRVPNANSLGQNTGEDNKDIIGSPNGQTTSRVASLTEDHCNNGQIVNGKTNKGDLNNQTHEHLKHDKSENGGKSGSEEETDCSNGHKKESEAQNDEMSFYLTCIHLSPKFSDCRIEEIKSIANDLRPLNKICRRQIWTGDFNNLSRQDYTEDEWAAIVKKREENKREAPTDEIVQEIKKLGFSDCWYKFGRPEPRTTSRFNTRVDYVYTSPEFDTSWTLVNFLHYPSDASDHNFVMAEFKADVLKTSSE